MSQNTSSILLQYLLKDHKIKFILLGKKPN